MPSWASYPNDMGADSAGNVYVVGNGPAASGPAGDRSLVRSNLGGNWQTIDSFQLAEGKATFGYGFAADPAGNVYVVGYGTDAANGLHAFVRSMAAAPSTVTFSSTSIGLEADDQADPWSDPSAAENELLESL